MGTLGHLYVVPVTGVERGRTCLVCRAQSSLAATVFINPQDGMRLSESDNAMKWNTAITAIKNDVGLLQASYVVLKPARAVPGPDGEEMDEVDENLRAEIGALEADQRSNVFKCVPPSGGLPPYLPIDPNAQNSIMLFRHRRVITVIKDLSFDNVQHQSEGSNFINNYTGTAFALQAGALGGVGQNRGAVEQSEDFINLRALVERLSKHAR